MRLKNYHKRYVVERVQTGVRIEKRLLKVLKALAEFHDLTLGDLLEGIVLHAFDGKTAFQKASRHRIKELKKFYGLDLDFRASHRLIESRATAQKPKTTTSRRARSPKPGRRSQKATRGR
jgi:predicted DNA-binding ribbon-helix-helix protein